MSDFILELLEVLVELLGLFANKTFNILCLLLSIFLIFYVSPWFIILSIINIFILIVLGGS